jgi:hypothetical protein
MSNARVAFELLRWSANRAPGWSGEEVTEETSAFLRSRGIDSLHHLASGVANERQEVYDLVWRHQLTALREVLSGLVEAGVRVLNFKGSELVPRHFRERGLGLMGDADLLVPRDQLEPAKAVLYGLGFRHAFFDPASRRVVDRDVKEIGQIELEHYELPPFVRPLRLEETPAVLELAADREGPLRLGADGPLALLEVDVHYSVASDADPEPFFARAVPGSLGVGETFSPADHVWFNLSRYYNEVGLHDKRSLRPLAYTLPEVASGRVDWAVVEAAACDLSLGPTLHYFLVLCDRLAPGHVPEATLAAVKRSTPSRARDWGWLLGKLFDFEEPFPAHAFAGAG